MLGALGASHGDFRMWQMFEAQEVLGDGSDKHEKRPGSINDAWVCWKRSSTNVKFYMFPVLVTVTCDIGLLQSRFRCRWSDRICFLHLRALGLLLKISKTHKSE